MTDTDREADENSLFTGETSCPHGTPPKMKMSSDLAVTNEWRSSRKEPMLEAEPNYMSHPEFLENSSNIRKDDKARIVSKFGG